MAKLKLIWKILDGIFGTFLGLTVIDLFSLFSFNSFWQLNWMDDLDNTIKVLMALAGFVYFVLRGIDEFKMRKLNRREKRIEIRKAEELLEMTEWENAEKKTPILDKGKTLLLVR